MKKSKSIRKIKGRWMILWTLILTVCIICVVLIVFSFYQKREKSRMLSEVFVSSQELKIISLEEALPDTYPWEDGDGEPKTVTDIRDLSWFDGNEKVEMSENNEYTVSEEYRDHMIYFLSALYGIMTVSDQEPPNLYEAALLQNACTYDNQTVFYQSPDASGISYAMKQSSVVAFTIGRDEKCTDDRLLERAKEQLSQALIKMELAYDASAIDVNDPIYRFYEWIGKLNYFYLETGLNFDKYYLLVDEFEVQPPERARELLLNTRSGYVYVRNGRLFLAYNLDGLYLRVQFEPESLDIVGYQIVEAKE